MKYATDTNHAIASAINNRAGQSMTSLLVGLAIMGCVGAGAAIINRQMTEQMTALSAKNGAGILIDAMADEIRKNTRYSEISAQYDGKSFDDDNEFTARTSVRKICNASPSTNCDVIHVDIEIVDKHTGEVVLKQTVTRTYTHYEEQHAFYSLDSLLVPEDAIGIRYLSESGAGANGGGNLTTYGYLLKLHSETCKRNYRPNTTTPPTACVPCQPAPSNYKEYWSGDCVVGRCPLGQQGTANKLSCEPITCPSGQVLVGDACITGVGAKVTGLNKVCHGTDGDCSSCTTFSFNVPTASLLNLKISKHKGPGADWDHNAGWWLVYRNGSTYKEFWSDNITEVVPAGTYTFVNRVCEYSEGVTTGYEYTAIDSTALGCTISKSTWVVHSASTLTNRWCGDDDCNRSVPSLSNKSYTSKSALLSALKTYKANSAQMSCIRTYTCSASGQTVNQYSWQNIYPTCQYYYDEGDSFYAYGYAQCSSYRVDGDDYSYYLPYISDMSINCT